MIDQNELKMLAASYEITLSAQQLSQFDLYAQTLVDWNEKVNLTAITAPHDICIKHFLDSMLLLDAVELPQKAKIIDVGTGAGFPSIPCKIVRNDLSITLLDSLKKRINFLSELSTVLQINTICIHARAEDAGKDPQFREKFDLVTARAVAHLRELSEYCLPLTKLGGSFVALKGYEIEEELEEAQKAIKTLGGEVVSVKKYSLPDDHKRAIVWIKKVSQTPTKYPRMTAKMKKQPLL